MPCSNELRPKGSSQTTITSFLTTHEEQGGEDQAEEISSELHEGSGHQQAASHGFSSEHPFLVDHRSYLRSRQET
jgi:hypothetical protein